MILSSSKNSKKNIYSYYFVTSFWLFIFEQLCKYDIFGEPVDPAEVPDYLGEFHFQFSEKSSEIRYGTIASRIQDLSTFKTFF